MKDNIVLVVHTSEGKTQYLNAAAGNPKNIKITHGSQYILKNGEDNYAPELLSLERVDQSLYIYQEGQHQPIFILDDYYATPDAPPLEGMAEDGQLYAYVQTDSETPDQGYEMGDGDLQTVALGDNSLGEGAAIWNAPADNADGTGTHALADTASVMYGLLGFLGTATVVGTAAAIRHHNQSRTSDTTTDDTDKPVVPDGSGGLVADTDLSDPTEPLMDGNATAGNTILISDNGVVIGSAIVDDSGYWIFMPDSPLGEGDHALVVSEVDANGTVIQTADPISVVVPPATTPDTLLAQIEPTDAVAHSLAINDAHQASDAPHADPAADHAPQDAHPLLASALMLAPVETFPLPADNDAHTSQAEHASLTVSLSDVLTLGETEIALPDNTQHDTGADAASGAGVEATWMPLDNSAGTLFHSDVAHVDYAMASSAHDLLTDVKVDTVIL